MKKTKEANHILKEWHKFEYRNKINESQDITVKQRPKESQIEKDLMKKKEVSKASKIFKNKLGGAWS